MNPRATVAVVAGSGLDLRPLLDVVDVERAFTDVNGLRRTGVTGHTGKFVFGTCESVRVVLQCGRMHLYEGITFAEVTAPVVALREFGVSTILFTNAAGGLIPEMQPGELMAVDSIGLWPYSRWTLRPDRLMLDFVPEGCAWRGIYQWVHGPCYETRAEISALRALGGGAVGMSTAPEVARAQSLNMRAGAISCITNNCCRPQVLTHQHVLRAASGASAQLCEVLREVITRDFARADC